MTMDHLKKRGTAFCAAAITASLCTSYRPPVAAAAAEDFGSLALRLNATKNTHLVAEPISVEATLSNPTSGVITAHNYLDPTYGYIRILISFEGGAFRAYRGPGWGIRDVIAKPKTIGPGQTLSQPMVLLYNHRSPDEIPGVLGFPAPGRYLVKAEFNDFGFRQKVESPTIRIDVADPEGVDRDAAEFLKSEEALYFLHTGFAQTLVAVREFETLVASYPQSRYAAYVREALTRQRASAQQMPSVTPDVEPGGAALSRELQQIVQAWAAAINAKDYDAAMRYASAEQQSKVMWERGGSQKEEVAQALARVTNALGTFSLRVRTVGVERQTAMLDVTVTTDRQGTFDSFIKLRKEGDGQWRITQVGFPN